MAQAARAEGSATSADQVGAHASRPPRQSSRRLHFRICSTKTCRRDWQKQADATDDRSWAIPEVPAICWKDCVAQRSLARAMAEIPSADSYGPSSVAAGCESLPGVAGCVHASGYTVRTSSRWSRNPAGGGGTSGRARLARSGRRLRRTRRGRLARDLALGDIVVGLEVEKDRDTALACPAASLPNIHTGHSAPRKEFRCPCEDSRQPATPGHLLRR